MASARLIGVGVFVLAGLALFAFGLFMIGDRRLMFTDSFEVHAHFERIAGLQGGAVVRVAGMNAGEVLEVSVPPGPEAPFRVRMRIRRDLHGLVRTDSVATIQTDGLVGAKFVQVDTGSIEAPQVADGGTIRSREPFDVTALMEEARQTVTTINEAILELRGDLETTIEAIGETVERTDQLIEETGTEITRLARTGNRMALEVEHVITDIRAGRGTLGRLVADDTLYVQAAGIAEEAHTTMRNVREASEQVRQVAADLRTDEGPVHSLAADLRHTVGFARDAMGNLADTTAALQQHWLFRGFFRDRGYFDLNRIPAADYLAGALETRDRAALRIWLDESVLFATDPAGTDVLTEGGMRRLDLAMAEFLRYPRESPLMVEGYADRTTRDERFLRARQRALIVRDYLIGRFDLEPNRVGKITLADGVAGTPPNGAERWSGVALALFVNRTAFPRVAEVPAEAAASDSKPARAAERGKR
jgi:phospholipid/cholesterol/gamma-HCH transport system substrate-binding protein